MSTSLIRRAAAATLVAVAFTVGGLTVAGPAQAVTVHNRMVVRVAGEAVVLDEWNISSAPVSYNIDCHTTSLWARYRYVAYKPGTSLRYFAQDVTPLRTYFINEYFWAKTRSYRSVSSFRSSWSVLLKRSSEAIKAGIGYYCLRDARRGETKVALEQYVDNIKYYVKRVDPSTNLATLDLASDEITTPHKIGKVFSVRGTPAGGYIASLTNTTDGYTWYFNSVTGKYSETAS